MFMDLFFLIVVGHTLQVALMVNLLNYLIHIGLNVLPHCLQFFDSLSDFVSFDLTKLTIPLSLLINKGQVFLSDVF